MDRQMLEAMAGALTLDDIRLRVVLHPDGVPLPPRWISQAVAFLRLHPEHLAAVGSYLAGAERHRSRELAADLLSNVGGPLGQKALRDALVAPGPRSDPDGFVAILQRFSLLEAPEAESAKVVRAVYQEGVRRGLPHWRHGAAYTLGAAARHARVAGAEALADEIVAFLIAELRTAQEAEARGRLLIAVGMSRAPQALQVLESQLRDDALRVHLVVALRAHASPRARELLTPMVTDADTFVRSTAISGLSAAPLSRPVVERLCADVLADRTRPGDDGALAQLLVAQEDAHALVLPALRHLGARAANAAHAASLREWLAEHPRSP